MKHNLPVTIQLIILFFVSQLVGLLIVSQYIDPLSEQTDQVTWKPLPFNVERPPIQESSSFLHIFLAIGIGTGFLLILIRYSIFRLWKAWYFLSVLICLLFAFAAFISETLALTLAIIFAIIKVFKPNVYIHNATELFLYGGLAAIFVPVMNITAASILLLLISIYDIWAVWHSKHMVKIAKFQTKAKLFAGLSIPYVPSKKSKTTRSHSKKHPSKKNVKYTTIKTAILGGGDIGFPLIFAAVVMKDASLLAAIPIPVFATLALTFLFVSSQKNKFYPAMPPLAIGCFIGYAISLVLF